MVLWNWRLKVCRPSWLFGVVSFFVPLPIVPTHQSLFATHLQYPTSRVESASPACSSPRNEGINKLTLLCLLFRLLHHHHNPKAPKAAAIPPTRAGIATATGNGFFSVVLFPVPAPEGVEEATTEIVVICCRPTRSIKVIGAGVGGAGVIWGNAAGIFYKSVDVICRERGREGAREGESVREYEIEGCEGWL